MMIPTRNLSLLSVVRCAGCPVLLGHSWKGMRPEGEQIRIVNANDVPLKVREATPVARACQWRRNSRPFNALAHPGPAKQAVGPKEWTVGPREVGVFVMHQERPLYLLEFSTLDDRAVVRCMFDNYQGDPKLMDDQGVARLEGSQGHFSFSWLVPVQPDPDPEPVLPPVVRLRSAARLDPVRLKAVIAEHREAIREHGRPILPNPQGVVEHPELNRANRTGAIAVRAVYPKQRMAARAALIRARMAQGATGPETI